MNGSDPKKTVCVSVIIPTINEGASLGIVIDSIKHVLENAGISYEIIIVDSDSIDDTKSIAESRNVKFVTEHKRGYGVAYKRGFKEASGSWIVTMDGDNTYDPAVIPDAINKATFNGWVFVSFKRIKQKGSMSFKHRIGNFILTVAMIVLFGIKIRDSQSGMWLIKKEFLDRFALISDTMPFSEEIKIEGFKHFKAAELPVNYYPRIGTPKLMSWRDGWLNLKFLFRKRFLGN
ncbi:MAG: glycosyltransferase family 2 protein [Candidatus Thermoplasmatota archaeon]|jgi:glycosyltransferase involved in cell wall biosynthesis|nr:glycosyltransferase family 2 protein [Candidatus Thermoplasmatota archaeon]MCL5963212.1 glycosyltransferase family 2 protein [Candidatus Thermoplasmatota archaeon]